MYMTGQPGVSTFVAEFLKRKDAELARNSNNSKGRKKKAGATDAGAPTTMAAVAGGAKVPVPVAAARGQAIVYPPPAQTAGTSPSGASWQQIPTVAKPVVKKAAAKKNQPKASGVYSVLGQE